MAAKEEKSSKTDSARAASSEKSAGGEHQQLADLYELMQAEGLDSLELKDEQTCIRLIRRSHAAVMPSGYMPVAAPAPAREAEAADAAPASESSGNTINTPLAGVLYRASSPSTPPFVSEGDVVDAGQTLCIVEAMKVMNEIKAESRCKITKILVENSRPVTAGQPLFQVESA
jgi:acetyl-CoA carboxylase biotin carboxyl carrier protein